MVGQHHPFNGHELGQTLGDSDGQGGLAYCSPWGHKRDGHNLATGKTTATKVRLTWPEEEKFNREGDLEAGL